MKASTLFCAAVMAVAAAQLLPVSCNGNAHTKPGRIQFSGEEPINWVNYSGMYFNSRYVVEEYETDDMCVIVYDDPDCGLDSVGIPVDPETYGGIIMAIREGYEMEGALVLNSDYECAMTFIP